MKILLLIACMIVSIMLVGCNEQSSDSRVVAQKKVKSDTMGDNILTRPFVSMGSSLMGHGVSFDDVRTRTNAAGLLEVNVKGYNKAYNTKQFEYFMEWFDKDGAVIESVASKWMPVSAAQRSNFSIKVTATNPEAVDFRMNTRKNRKVK